MVAERSHLDDWVPFEQPRRLRLAAVGPHVDADTAGEQPRCPPCGVVMRDVPGGWQCPSCMGGLLALPPRRR